MCIFSQYKDMFGEPGQGVHAYRVGDLAIIDVLATLIGAFMLAWIMRWNVVVTTVGLFLLGILAHHLFGVRTTVDRWLFRA